MMEQYTIRPIGRIRSDYKEKFGIPKQCGLVTELMQTLVIEPEFSNIDALREIEKFEYIWLIWGFSKTHIDMTEEPVRWFPTVRPPRLGGRRVGVWASRSPYRPNSLALSSVRLHGITLDGRPVSTGELTGPVAGELAVVVSGADLMDGTPVFDIKPYLPYSDSHPDASDGYSKGAKDPDLQVDFPEELLCMIDEPRRAGLLRILSLDPRDAYDKKPGCTYGMAFADWDIRFFVEDDVLHVTGVVEKNAG